MERHLGTCDACVGTLGMLHRRLSVESVVDVPVPDGLRQRRPRCHLEPTPDRGRVEELAARAGFDIQVEAMTCGKMGSQISRGGGWTGLLMRVTGCRLAGWAHQARSVSRGVG